MCIASLISADANPVEYVLMHVGNNGTKEEIFEFSILEIKKSDENGNKSEYINRIIKCSIKDNTAKKMGAHIFGSGQYKDRYFSIKATIEAIENGVMVLVPIENSFEKFDIGKSEIIHHMVSEYKKKNEKL